MDTLETAEPINRHVPTGGVRRPIPQLRTIIIPNWTGSIPILFASGRRIGVAIRIIGAMSMIHPRNSRIILIRSVSTMGLSVSPEIAMEAKSGT